MSTALSIDQKKMLPRLVIAAVLGTITGLVIHLYLLLSAGFVYQDLHTRWVIAAIVIGMLVALAITALDHRLNESSPWHQNVGRRLMISLLINAIITWIAFYILYCFFWNNLAIEVAEYPSFDRVIILKLSLIILVIIAIFSIIQYALFSFQTFAYTHINETKLQRELIDIQMNTLKSQLRPHFLFNSLNTISSLIHSDLQAAERFIRQLASTYNYTLSNYNKETVSLGEELELVQAYVKMMKVRFGEGVSFVIDVPDRVRDSMVLPLSIQTLIENALKHNVVSQSVPLEITVKYLDGKVRVRNNKTMRPNSVESGKIGLSNLKRRLYLWNGSRIEIQDTDQFFKVILPLTKSSNVTI